MGAQVLKPIPLCRSHPTGMKPGHLVLALSVLLLCDAAIVDLIVIEGEHSACPEDYSKVPPTESLNGDLNQGSGGDYIYLCAKSNVQDDPVTDLTVVAEGGGDGGCGDLDGDWHRISQQQGSNGDFNHGAGGKYIYLCYRKEKGKGPLIQLNLHEHDCDAGMSRVDQDKDSNGDFNQGAGGKYIYLCKRRGCVAETVQGSWVTHGSIAAPITETWKHGTTKTHSESKTDDWSESVSVKVSQGWSLFGEKGSVEITGTFAHSTSNTYSTEWSVSDEHDFTISWGKEDVGKEAWQFNFDPSDSCGHSETTLVQEFAITEGAFRPPCCVPGFATDAPAYKTCHSAAVMVAGGKDYGCKVAGEDDVGGPTLQV